MVMNRIVEIMERYYLEDGTVRNGECAEEIAEMLKAVVGMENFTVNSNYVDCGPGYEQTFYVFAWVEQGQLDSYEVLVESFQEVRI